MKSCKMNLLLVFVCIFIIFKSETNAQNDNIIFPDDLRLTTFPPWYPVRVSSTRQPTILIPNRTTRQVTATPPTTRTNSVTTPTIVRTTPTPEFTRCMKSCPTTSQYNPICGTDRMIYFNEQRLVCAQLCGSNVQIAGRGNCAGLFGTAFGTW